MGIFPGKEFPALLQLLGNTLCFVAIVGAKSAVVAVGAASTSDGAVAVRARETGIETQFLHLTGEVTLQEVSEGGVWGAMVCRHGCGASGGR